MFSFAPKLEPLKYLNKGSGMFIFAPKLEPLKYLNIKGVAPNWMAIFASKLEPLKYLNMVFGGMLTTLNMEYSP